MNTIPHPDSQPKFHAAELALVTVDSVNGKICTMDEILITVRNAAKARRIEGTPRQHWQLAENFDNHAKRISALADELRRIAK